ncbi:siphovirus ReqiPepy6 Gp37-like family protein [Streptomyces catenulae]|uniref:Siphovirus ReqiPepy6 Gp37-like family protein n=1 Tax=Streptomyces catenulae TaxID=66875 RepID=A0ABV2YTF1_9ACTN|nr:siphovirus ReqiPepy6 Gp37-like family protein [Streptomyces catenulae]
MLEVQDTFNNVGSWKLTLPTEHPLTEALRVPGAGLIITGPADVLMSGPVTSFEYAATPEDRRGSVVFDGVSDSVALLDMLAWPEPSNPDVTTQSARHDERTGPAETLMHAYVAANCGPAAPAARRRAGLVMGPDRGRGPVVSKSARFPTLGELLTAIAVVADLGFRIVQRADSLVFETYQLADRTKEVRLDVLAGTLAGQRVSVSTPGATRVIVAGQGEQEGRTFVPVSSDASEDAEADWGRRIERFVDQRNTDDLDELAQAGNEVLADEGHTSTTVQAVPVEDSAAEFGVDWNLGDRVTVIAGGRELTAPVTGTVVKAGSDGFKTGALLGDPANLDPGTATAKRAQGTERRVSALERSAEASPPTVAPAPRTPDVFLPADLGLKTWAFDPGLGMSSFVYPSSGSLRITAVPLHTTTTVSQIVWHVFGYAGGLLSGSNAGIYDSTGTRLAQVGDMSGEKKLPGVHNVGGATVGARLTESVTLSPGIYYVAWFFRYTVKPVDGPALLVADSAASAPPGRLGLTNVHRFGAVSSVSGLPTRLDFNAFEGGPNRFWAGLA